MNTLLYDHCHHQLNIIDIIIVAFLVNKEMAIYFCQSIFNSLAISLELISIDCSHTEKKKKKERILVPVKINY